MSAGGSCDSGCLCSAAPGGRSPSICIFSVPVGLVSGCGHQRRYGASAVSSSVHPLAPVNQNLSLTTMRAPASSKVHARLLSERRRRRLRRRQAQALLMQECGGLQQVAITYTSSTSADLLGERRSGPLGRRRASLALCKNAETCSTR